MIRRGSEKAHCSPLKNQERRCTHVEKTLLDVLAEADQAHREILWRRLLDLPDVEIDEAHREHVVSEKGELVFAVRVVRLESVPQKLDVFLLLRGFEGERQVVGEFGGFFHGSDPRALLATLADRRNPVI